MRFKIENDEIIVNTGERVMFLLKKNTPIAHQVKFVEVALIENTFGTVSLGSSRCSPSDEYDEITGYKLALERLIDGLGYSEYWNTLLTGLFWTEYHKEN